MTEEKEKNKQEAGKNIPEEEIVTLDDFDFKTKGNYKRLLCCPKCQSSAICLDAEFAKNNLVNSLEEKDVLKKVLRCVNCNYKDLAAKFLQVEVTSTTGFSPIWSNPNKVYPIKKYPIYSAPTKKTPILSPWSTKNKIALAYKKHLRGR